MDLSREMNKAIQDITDVKGYICHGLVNYQKGVSALQETSDPSNKVNFFPQQCSNIINTLYKSLDNLNGGTPDKIKVESSKMTMLIYLVNDTYFCGIGLQPGVQAGEAEDKLENLRHAFKKHLIERG